MKDIIKTDCRRFPLDRPCRPHKDAGVECAGCTRYEPLFSPAPRGGTKSILIVKLDAMGDVLRTTFLLPGLRELHPGASITWVVAPQSVSLLERNPLLSRVWPFGKDVFGRITAEVFDEVINLDLSPLSLSLATIACARKRTGFWFDGRRRIRCSGRAAREWLAMSASDRLKKANEHTYQHWMARIAGLPRADYEIQVPLRRDSVARARKFAREHKLSGDVVGINPGAGQRWKFKRWTDAGYLRVIRDLASRGKRILLLGGPEEKTLLERLAVRSGGAAVNAGTENTLPDFFALINLCDLVITGDTMALHAALGLGKKAVALFGPTSAPEIEMYGRGIKLVPPLPCVCCYRQSCDVKPNCMESIKLPEVLAAVGKLI